MLWCAGEYRVEFPPRVKVKVAVMEEETVPAPSMITPSAGTGETGNGRILVIYRDDAVRTQTGDRCPNTV